MVIQYRHVQNSNIIIIKSYRMTRGSQKDYIIQHTTVPQASTVEIPTLDFSVLGVLPDFTVG